MHDDGMITVKAGTSAHGQGHATAFSQIAADQFGVPIERIRYVQSDTALVARGGGTGGSRSVQLGGTAVLQTSKLVVERAKELVAELLEAAPEDIVVSGDGRLGVAGVPDQGARVGRGRAGRHERRVNRSSSSTTPERSGSTFPFGAHVAVVEVDTETGRVVPVRHFAVDDCGVIVNPLLVDGQVHGGLASGIAQALWEQFLYDEDGNPLTSTLAEYAMPSAAELPSFTTAHTETPSPMNDLGAKGIGESATVGSTPAVQNAVVDALSHLGVRHIDMPCTPERVWRAMQATRGRGHWPIRGASRRRRWRPSPRRAPRARTSNTGPRASTSDPPANGATMAGWARRIRSLTRAWPSGSWGNRSSSCPRRRSRPTAR